MKLFLALVVLLAANSSSGQKKDQHWLDSLQSVIHNIDKDEMYEKPSLAKKYISINLVIGEYYEKMFQKNELPDLKKAMGFYRSITEMGIFHDREEYYSLMATRNNLCRKLSNIYFFGKGIKADREKALELAVKGMGNNKEFFKIYSKRFYDCECTILSKQNNAPGNDSVFKLNVNPFAFPVVSDLPVKDQQLADMVKALSASRKFSKSYLYISVYAQGTVQGDYNAEALMEKLKDYFTKNMDIDPEKILFSSEYDYNSNKMNLVEIKFKVNKEELDSH
jgi:hypothetical protein